MHLATCQLGAILRRPLVSEWTIENVWLLRGAAATSLMNTLNRPGLEFTGRFTGAHAGVHAAVPHCGGPIRRAFSPGIARPRRGGSRVKTGHGGNLWFPRRSRFMEIVDFYFFYFWLNLIFYGHFLLFTSCFFFFLIFRISSLCNFKLSHLNAAIIINRSWKTSRWKFFFL